MRGRVALRQLLIPFLLSPHLTFKVYLRHWFARLQPTTQELCADSKVPRGFPLVRTLCNHLLQQLYSHDTKTMSLVDVGIKTLKPKFALIYTRGQRSERVKISIYFMLYMQTIFFLVNKTDGSTEWKIRLCHCETVMQ